MIILKQPLKKIEFGKQRTDTTATTEKNYFCFILFSVVWMIDRRAWTYVYPWKYVCGGERPSAHQIKSSVGHVQSNV